MPGSIDTPYGPVAGETIEGIFFPSNLLADALGADAMGTVEASPHPFTLLGRLKTIGDLMAQLVELQGGSGGTGASGDGALDFSQPGNPLMGG